MIQDNSKNVATPFSFYRILHAMLREDDSPAELERAKAVLKWAVEKQSTLKRVTTDPHPIEWWQVLGKIIRTFTRVGGDTVTKVALELALKDDQRSKPLLDILTEYGHYDERIGPRMAAADLHVPLETLKRGYEETLLNKHLMIATEICNGSRKNPKKDEPDLAGPRDAHAYYLAHTQRHIFLDDDAPLEGLVSEMVDDAAIRYARASRDRACGSLRVPSGLAFVDEHFGGGLRRGDFVGVLGFTGQRKSGVIRTMTYHAALAGHAVLHIPIETTVAEEVDGYSAMHAHGGRFTSNGVRKIDLMDGNLYDGGEQFMNKFVWLDFKHTFGQNIAIRDARDCTWKTIEAIIRADHQERGTSLVVIDYLGLIDHPGSRDPVGDMNRTIKACKTLARKLNICIVTPVQGNRGGFDKAEQNDGVWTIDGVLLYSEFDRSLDVCFYVYSSPELSALNQTKIGTCKNRRGLDIPARFVHVQPHSQMLSTELDSEEVSTFPERVILGVPEYTGYLDFLEKTGRLDSI